MLKFKSSWIVLNVPGALSNHNFHENASDFNSTQVCNNEPESDFFPLV